MHNRRTALFTGILILLAYTMLASEVTNSHPLIMLFDVISGLSVIGIAILLRPHFLHFAKKTTNYYFWLKLTEGTLMILAGLTIVTDPALTYHNWIYEIPHLIVFIVSGYLFYHLLGLSRLVPRFIAIWGKLAILTLLLNNLGKLIEINSPIFDSLLILIISNEVFLAFFLIIKGFSNPSHAKQKSS